MSRLRWLLPGIGIKRWLLLGSCGIGLCGLALGGLLGIADPGASHTVTHTLAHLPPIAHIALLFGGLGLCMTSFAMLNRAVLQGLPLPKESKNYARAYLRNRLLQRGPRIVVIGGGTGLSTVLEGLKEHSSNLTAVVTVSDDGGSSGRLRKELEMLPPGDIRNCLVALARRGPLMSNLLQYRFSRGKGLTGHSFGNLLIAALTEMTGSFIEAVRATSDVLAIAGEVLPSTCQNVVLGARFEDGKEVLGESKIPRRDSRIVDVFLKPRLVHPPHEVLDRIAEADLIVLGPGSLFTSVIPNLLVSGVAEAVNGAKALVAYVSNIMTQPGETQNFNLVDHVHMLLELTPLTRIDTVLFNSRTIDSTRMMNYEREGATRVSLPTDFRSRFDINVLEADVLSLDGLVRHDPRETARVLVGLIGSMP